jgi:uncharacterized protein with PQ loop repeat
VKRATLQVLAAICFVNFPAWCVIAMLMGGTPDSGASGADKFFLSNHGTLTQVSHAIYIYSYVHTMASLCGLGIFAIVASYLSITAPRNSRWPLGKWPAVAMIASFLVSLLAIMGYVLLRWLMAVD